MVNQSAYVLASLEDKKAKELGSIISNEKARKILNLLTKKNATETEISKELRIPLSTAHYNIKQLIKTGLISVKGFYYSKKGNKVNVYTLSKKLILIAPRGVSLARSKIKAIIPTILIAGALSGLIKLFYSARYQMLNSGVSVSEPIEAAPIGSEVSKTILPQISQLPILSNYYALFFLAGALLGLGIYLIFTWRKR